ncbi:MAG TPA: hypothetical protein EYQ74_14955 [Planctomycetes bacterium]|nr:hypothetical protein [Planctomycetota bacterium]HIK62313.1 hypothetical protein [Planctomycetota bacterium]
MDSLNQGRGSLPDGPDDPNVIELLTHWDELPEAGLANITAHPVHGARLEMLRAADDWLDGQTPSTGGCPSAGTLYDFAKGPGYVPLDPQSQDEVLCHLTECKECADLLISLESSPPVPLDWSPAVRHQAAADTGEDLPTRPASWGMPQGGHRPAPIRILRRLAPIAAALTALVGGLMLFQGGDAPYDLPTYPLLRGSAEGSLLFPRGPVLLASENQDLLFEVNPVAEAQSYTIILRAHGGGAFAEGSRVTQLNGDGPELALGQILPVGHYTWEAHATVNGLEQPLGERDFEVRHNDSFLQALTEEQDVRERVRSLHEAGYWTDARAAARRLPPSSERDSYLGSNPGR